MVVQLAKPQMKCTTLYTGCLCVFGLLFSNEKHHDHQNSKWKMEFFDGLFFEFFLTFLLVIIRHVFHFCFSFKFYFHLFDSQDPYDLFANIFLHLVFCFCFFWLDQFPVTKYKIILMTMIKPIEMFHWMFLLLFTQNNSSAFIV